MSRIYDTFTRTLSQAIDRLQRRFRRARPGSVLIMVVALLVLLALMGTAYLATARNDRLAGASLRDSGLEAAAKQIAQEQVDRAAAWIAGDPAMFTSHSVDGRMKQPNGADGTSYLAPRQPQAFNSPSPSGIAIGWPRVTNPQGFPDQMFRSPFLLQKIPNKSGSFANYATDSYDLNAHDLWAIPVGIPIVYPTSYANPKLAGRTLVYPGFRMVAYNALTNTWVTQNESYLAADATGWGVADSGLIELDTPEINGVRWFAGWRIVDNAAAINVNTAMWPQYDADVYYTNGNGGTGNSMNHFPSDVDLLGLFNQKYNPSFNPGNLATSAPEELKAINDRRLIGIEAFQDPTPSSTKSPAKISVFDDDGKQHPDALFSSPAEVLWTYLGRRTNLPFSIPPVTPQVAGGSTLLQIAGDPLENYGRPFGDTDTGTLAYHGVMADPYTPSSKIDQLFYSAPTGYQSDSVYRSAVNYFLDPRNRFTRFGANQVAYWFDYNFNFGAVTGSIYNWNASTNGASGPSQLMKLTLNTQLGTSISGIPYRDPRHMLVGSNPVLNLSRFVDPKQLPQSVIGNGGGGGGGGGGANSTTPTTMPALSATARPHKTSLNTADFPELWRAFANVFNNFPSEDGTTSVTTTNGLYPLHITSDPQQQDLRDPLGPGVPTNGPVAASDPYTNPRQFRSIYRDPQADSTISNGDKCFTNNVTGPTASRLLMDAKNVLCLRAALAAVNVVTLRDQHGLSLGGGAPGQGYFSPDVAKQTVTLQEVTSTGNYKTTSPVDVIAYGVGVQPYITEVYASTDNVTQDKTSGASNPNGLVVVKLFNPYPFDVPLKGYELALVQRTGFGAGMSTSLIDKGSVSFASTVVPSKSYLLLTNYQPGKMYWPTHLGAPPAANAQLVTIDNLGNVFQGATDSNGGTSNGGELLLLRPLDGAGTKQAEVPVDSFDFSGLSIQQNPAMVYHWHYVRDAGVTPPSYATNPPSMGHVWRCVYAGPYSGTGDFPDPAKTQKPAPNTGTKPHYLYCDQSSSQGFDPKTPDPWDAGGGPTFSFTSGESSHVYGDPAWTPQNLPDVPGIQLCNVDFAGFNKIATGGAAKAFPYGGFAKTGDVVLAPFVGSYVILNSGAAGTWPPKPAGAGGGGGGAGGTAVSVHEVNPVTIDTCFADDGDPDDNAYEQVGRFVPVYYASATKVIDDTSPSGYYSFTVQADPTTGQPPPKTKIPPSWYLGSPPVNWRYHFAIEAMNQFTAVANPADDYTPNMNPLAWNGMAPRSVNNTGSSLYSANQGNEDSVPVEGLINVNTADWRTLAAVEMIPRSQDPTGSANAALAQAIVHYRDVDDGMVHYDPSSLTWDGTAWQTSGAPLAYPRGHGPFNSLWELNAVFVGNPSGVDATGRRLYPATFENALGLIPNTFDSSKETDRRAWGYFVPGPQRASGSGNLQLNDWVVPKSVLNAKNTSTVVGGAGSLMVERLSNLLTTRSDSFTVYVIIQGWRNPYTTIDSAKAANLPRPELVIEKRMAVTVDRSGVNVSNKTPKTYEFNAK